MFLYLAIKGTVNKWSKCSKEQVGVWANDIIKIYGKHCKDKSKGKGTSKGKGKGKGKGKATATTCKDKCPGNGCMVSPDNICKMVKRFGGCKGMFSNLLKEYCKKSCGLCK